MAGIEAGMYRHSWDDYFFIASENSQQYINYAGSIEELEGWS